MVDRKSWHNPSSALLEFPSSPSLLRAEDLHHINLRRCSLGQQFGIVLKPSLIAGIDTRVSMPLAACACATSRNVRAFRKLTSG